MDLPEIKPSDYWYSLPEERIAQHPLDQRDRSKLLVTKGKHIEHGEFYQLGDYLPAGTMLVFNDTRVIPARLLFKKSTGAIIEIFLLNPVTPFSDINLAMQATSGCSWSCMIGNRKRWGIDQQLELNLSINEHRVIITASRVDNIVTFDWDAEVSFVELIRNAGQVPLPPYMKRQVVEEDKQRYQTVYSKVHGAVAAPTAGLHFTDQLLKSLQSKGIEREYVTLHVGAGTFQPIKTEQVKDHPMHGEQVSITLETIDRLIAAHSLVSVGTTSLRTLESLYWYGVKLLNELGDDFNIPSLMPYQEYPVNPSFKQSLQAVKSWIEAKNLQQITGHTEIFIFPPYRIKSSVGLITNFHLPGSTLILLVAAFIGEHWKQVYQEALRHDYRFLSYGDSSLLLPGKE